MYKDDPLGLRNKESVALNCAYASDVLRVAASDSASGCAANRGERFCERLRFATSEAASVLRFAASETTSGFTECCRSERFR